MRCVITQNNGYIQNDPTVCAFIMSTGAKGQDNRTSGMNQGVMEH